MSPHRFALAPARPLHPVHAVLLSGSLSLFLGALLSDWAYAASFEIQWTNFAAWLIAGALVFSGAALAWALVDLVRTRGHGIVYFVLVLAAWLLGLVNAFVHAKDAWAAMPASLVLSVIVTALVAVAVWFGFAGIRSGAAQ